MKEALIKLLKVKSIITLLMVGCLVYGFVANKITNEQFIPLITMIITFYFAKQDKKESNDYEV